MAFITAREGKLGDHDKTVTSVVTTGVWGRTVYNNGMEMCLADEGGKMFMLTLVTEAGASGQ